MLAFAIIAVVQPAAMMEKPRIDRAQMVKAHEARADYQRSWTVARK